VQDAMDLALYTGQRPADVLKIVVGDIANGKLFVAQNKTGKKLRIAIEGDLADVIARIMAKPRDRVNQALLQDPSGHRLTYTRYVRDSIRLGKRLASIFNLEICERRRQQILRIWLMRKVS
jgi:integrase